MVIYVICHNNGWLVRDTLEALNPFDARFAVIDNASADLATQNYLHSLRANPRVSVTFLPRNMGPRYFYRPWFWEQMPEFFAVTDPDLAYPTSLPVDFLLQLKAIAFQTGLFKAGLALDTSGPPEIFQIPQHIVSEAVHWREDRRLPLPPNHPAMYIAPIDTTFAVYCKKNYKRSMFGPAVRVAGHYTARHRPWYKTFWEEHAEQLRTTYDGAIYSTTGFCMAEHLGIAPIAFRPWSRTDAHPAAPEDAVKQPG